MKTSILASILFAALTSSAQDSLDIKVSSDLCTCLTQRPIITEDYFIKCFQSAMEQNSELIVKECKARYNDTSYETGYKFGQALYSRVSVSMIYSCNSYYNLMDTLRYSSFHSLDKDSLMKEIQSMNKSDLRTWTTDSFTQRGVSYFLVSDLDNAIKDFDAAIKLDKSAFQSIYFKAWALELKKNYDDAFSLYTKLALMTNKNDFKIFAAIAKRKKNGL